VETSPPVPSRRARWRWLHLVAAGGLLFLVKGAGKPAVPAEATAGQTITIDATTLAQLHGDFRRRVGRDPVATEEEGLVRQYADDEILYRRALLLGIDRNFAVRLRLASNKGFVSDVTEPDSPEEAEQMREDERHGRALQAGHDKTDPVLRRMLIENMRVAFRYSALDLTPEDAVLQGFVDEHPKDFTAPARVTFVHVFFSRAKRGPALAKDAAAALEKLRAGEQGGAERLGDAFAEGSLIRRRSLGSLARIFGPSFAPAVQRLTPGLWSDPIPSERGLHLVRVDTLEPARLLVLDEIRGQVLARWRADRGEQRTREAIEELRESYPVRVERSADDTTVLRTG